MQPDLAGIPLSVSLVIASMHGIQHKYQLSVSNVPKMHKTLSFFLNVLCLMNKVSKKRLQPNVYVTVAVLGKLPQCPPFYLLYIKCSVFFSKSSCNTNNYARVFVAPAYQCLNGETLIVGGRFKEKLGSSQHDFAADTLIMDKEGRYKILTTFPCAHARRW